MKLKVFRITKRDRQLQFDRRVAAWCEPQPIQHTLTKQESCDVAFFGGKQIKTIQ